MDRDLILAIDQGTSGTKAILFDGKGGLISKGFVALQSYFPALEYVEQDPDEIYQSVIESVRECLQNFSTDPAELSRIKTCGISNQRETFVLWQEDGTLLSPAIVWQCKRSIDICNRIKSSPLDSLISERTGLLIDPYFSGTKLMWLNDNVASINAAIANRSALFGTIDTWLINRLTNRQSYATDYTNASRTLLFNLEKRDWDNDILAETALTHLNLPSLQPSSSHFGVTDFEGLLPAAISIAGVIGDSHAAAFGEGCFNSGDAKATLGTGSSILMNVGSSPIQSTSGMVSTLCWSLENRVDYALEGIIVSCGSTIKWLGDQLGIFDDVTTTSDIAQSLESNGGVYLIPAFSGLGAPHWKMEAKASIHGLTFACDQRHVIRAGLESVCFQIKDVLTAMAADSGIPVSRLRVDGGLSKNRFAMQYLANLLQAEVASVGFEDISALGAAYMAGLSEGIFADLDQLSKLNPIENIFKPDTKAENQVAMDYHQWQILISQTT